MKKKIMFVNDTIVSIDNMISDINTILNNKKKNILTTDIETKEVNKYAQSKKVVM